MDAPIQKAESSRLENDAISYQFSYYIAIIISESLYRQHLVTSKAS